MKSFAITSAALIAVTSASTVTLTTTPCLDPSIPTSQFSIELNTAAPVRLNLARVCGLKIVSVSDDVDINAITCRAYRDAAGTAPGSADFSYAAPALISTNPVEEGSVWCTTTTTTATTSSSSSIATPSLLRRQDTSTTIPAATSPPKPVVRTNDSAAIAVSSASSSERSSSMTIQTLHVSTIFTSTAGEKDPSSTAQPAITRTLSVGVPSGTGNAAGRLGAGMGVFAGVVAAMVV